MDNQIEHYLLLREIASSCLILLGVVFMLISSIGILRLPDFYIRMSAITKGATLGVGLILLGMAIYFNQADIFFKVFIIITFIFITAPVAAHVIARTAVHNRVPFWKETNLQAFQDYLKDHVGTEEENLKK